MRPTQDDHIAQVSSPILRFGPWNDMTRDKKWFLLHVTQCALRSISSKRQSPETLLSAAAFLNCQLINCFNAPDSETSLNDGGVELLVVPVKRLSLNDRLEQSVTSAAEELNNPSLAKLLELLA